MLACPLQLRRYSCSLVVLPLLPLHLRKDVYVVLDILLNLGWGREMAELRAGV